MLTPAEKRAIRLVAIAWDATESDLLRDYSVARLVAECETIEAALPARPNAAA
jgi:hypothetical protein